MKNLFWAILMAALAIGMPWLAWAAYAEVADLHENGSEGALTVLSDTGTTRGRKGKTTHHYAASLEGIPIRLSTSYVLSPGYSYPVLFSREKLSSYAGHSSGSFYAYKIGRKSEPKWDIFVRDFGKWLLWGMVVLEFLWIFGAWAYWRSFRKNEKG